ncbi:MAG: DUF3800 domain-containing protein [bacterium]
MKKQSIYIYMDDSGKLSEKEVCFSYGGVYFTNRDNRDNFKRLYTSFINENKCRLCKKIKCDNICEEIKSNNTKANFKRRIINMIKNNDLVKSHSITIYNEKIDKYVFKNRHTKGRREDYFKKILIKAIIKEEIAKKRINVKDDLEIIINIDDSKRASNGIYNLKESILEELKYGIVNFNYGTSFPPLIKGNLLVEINFVNSENNKLVQVSDFLVGYVNASLMHDNLKKKIDVQIIL